MTEPSEHTPAPADPPLTGHAAIDAALADLELGPDVAEHPDRIAAVVDVMQAALGSPAPAAPASAGSPAPSPPAARRPLPGPSRR